MRIQWALSCLIGGAIGQQTWYYPHTGEAVSTEFLSRAPYAMRTSPVVYAKPTKVPKTLSRPQPRPSPMPRAKPVPAKSSPRSSILAREEASKAVTHAIHRIWAELEHGMRLTEGQRDKATDDALKKLLSFTNAVRNAYALAKDAPGETLGEVLNSVQGKTFIDHSFGNDEGGFLYADDGTEELRPRPQRFVNPMRRLLSTSTLPPKASDEDEGTSYYYNIFHGEELRERFARSE